MRVALRSLLVAAIVVAAASVVSCSLNDHGLTSVDAGRASTGAAGAGAAGAAAAGAPGAAGMTTGGGGSALAGLAGTTGGAGTTGAAGLGSGGGAGDAAGAGGASSGAAGDGSAAGAGGASTAGAGGASTAGAAGTATAGTGGGVAGAGGASASGGNAGGAAGTSVGGGGSGGSTSTTPDYGCSDKTREGYTDLAKYPTIAACSGGWDEPGLISSSARTPQCNRRAGNDGQKPSGSGCSAADLCATGWHVCLSAQEVSDIPGGCADALSDIAGSAFFATAQHAQLLSCTTNDSGTNNVYGCGNIGSTPDHSCQPLNRFLHDTDCSYYPPWQCSNGPPGTSSTELDDITKVGSTRGGVLCCKD
jgi:hypothetical protein